MAATVIHIAEPVTYKVGEHHAEPVVVEAGGESRHFVLEGGAVLHASAFVLVAPDDREEGGGGTAKASLALVVDLAGEGAEFHFHALCVAGGGKLNHAAIEVTINHLAPNCTSRQLIKGIVAGSAAGEFTGLVHVAPGAQKTDAAQRNQNLQLTDTAQVITRPGLEIYADDVRCSHGATIGRLDDEQIYYMRQRGIPEAEARRMQLHGFAGEIVDRIASEQLREPIRDRVAAMIDRL